MNHPSKDIIGTKGIQLKDKRIALCISGSVAATRSPEIARELMRYGGEVFTVMSSMAQTIIHPYLMEWATGNPVVTALTGKIEHVALAGFHDDRVDLLLIAPATANTISKIACGIDDTPVTSVITPAFGSGIPIMIVPAMHESMYHHPILNENIRRLKAVGVEFVGPRIEEGKAKIADTPEIVEAVLNRLSIKKDMSNVRMLITAGPTLEYLDPIRIITNKSSGKMGIAIAEEALVRGVDVTLVYGAGTATPPEKAEVLQVETTEQMYDVVVKELKSKSFDVVIATAAVADWTPVTSYSYKVPTKDSSKITIELKTTPKIIEAVKKLSPNSLLVPFKAEHNLTDDELIKKAYDRLTEVNADLIVANDVGKKNRGFMVDTNEVFIIDKDRKVIHIPLTTKKDVARQLIDVISKKLSETTTLTPDKEAD